MKIKKTLRFNFILQGGHHWTSYQMQFIRKCCCTFKEELFIFFVFVESFEFK